MRATRTIICFACLFALAGARFAQAPKSEPAYTYVVRCAVPQDAAVQPLEVAATDLEALQPKMNALKDAGRLTAAHRCTLRSEPRNSVAR